jgi:hypothetical protein
MHFFQGLRLYTYPHDDFASDSVYPCNSETEKSLERKHRTRSLVKCYSQQGPVDSCGATATPHLTFHLGTNLEATESLVLLLF